ncbi:hypothetical protein LTR28_007463 [Elasticomyces elasticus]|nr:hypothetical protein LTR28_007463 [Elasticomyces elasticus]
MHGVSGIGGPVAMDLDVDMDMEVEVETEAEAVAGITEVNEAVGPVEFLHEDGMIAALGHLQNGIQPDPFSMARHRRQAKVAQSGPCYRWYQIGPGTRVVGEGGANLPGSLGVCAEDRDSGAAYRPVGDGVAAGDVEGAARWLSLQDVVVAERFGQLEHEVRRGDDDEIGESEEQSRRPHGSAASEQIEWADSARLGLKGKKGI